MSRGNTDSKKSEKGQSRFWGRRKHFFTFLVKLVFGVPLLVFSLWLLKLVYLPEYGFTALMKETHQLQEQEQEHQVFQNILQSEDAVPKDHFHLVDHFITDQPEPYRPLCYLCHGNYPHSKGKEVRSLLNMHSGYMACSVCHVRKDPTEEKYYFVWVDRQTGRISMGVEGSFGRYPAKIFPMLETEDGEKKIFRPVSEKAAEEFIRLKTQFTPDQMAQAKRKLHQRLAEKPVFCAECHKKDGYFNFAELHYPKNRRDYLSSNEIARMIEHYKTFYIPEVIDFGNK